MTDSSHVLDVSAAPAVVEWADIDGRTQYLPESLQLRISDQVSFDLYFDTSSNTAFFKLHIPLFTKSLPRKNTPLYLFIPPERVATLFIECSDVPNDVTKQLGTDVIRLQFELDKHADLITPRLDWVPKNDLNKGIVSVSATLAQRLTITIYVACRLSEEQLRPLCDAISSRGVWSKSQTNLAGLYQGKGGQVCEDVNALMQAYLPKPLYLAEDGPSGARQQDGTPRADSVVPPYLPSPLTAGSSFVDNPRKRPRYGSDAGLDETGVNTDGTDADNKGAHVIALGRLEAELYSNLEKRLYSSLEKRFDVMNEEMQATKQELLETKQELQATRLELQATNRKLEATMKELLATRKLSQAMRKVQRETKQSTREELRETIQKANRILRESNRELQAATQEMQATKQELQTTDHAIGQESFEVRARLDQEVTGLHRLLKDIVEMFVKAQDRTEERSSELFQLLKGVMGVLSRMTEMTAGTTRGTARTTAGGTAGSGQARMPRTTASNSGPVPPPRSRPLATTSTTGSASSRLSRLPHVSNNLVDSSTDRGLDSLGMPPPRPLPFPTPINRANFSTDRGPASLGLPPPRPTTINPADYSTDSGSASPSPECVPPPRVLPLSTTANPADSSTDSGPDSPVADSVPPPMLL